MNKGFCILAQNNKTTDYVRQAYACALSIIKFNPDAKISLITNDKVSAKYKKVFDKIIDIPWDDQAQESTWKVENRWKIYHVTPYDETIVCDADVLFLQNINHWWKELNKYNLFFVTNPTTYRNEPIGNAHRKTFIANDLPMLYSTIHYFKKCNEAKEFYIMLEIVVNNWELFYTKFAKERFQKWCSIDMSAAIACKILGIETQITNTNSFINFVHMKPKIQHWNNIPSSWTKAIGKYLKTDGSLMIGNFLQTKPFHYVEDNFLSNEIIKQLESA